MSPIDSQASPKPKRTVKALVFPGVLGAIVLAVGASQHGIVRGLIGAAIIWAVVGLMFLFKGRGETISIMRGDNVDERGTHIRTRAAAQSFLAVYFALIAVFLVELGRGAHDARLWMFILIAYWLIWLGSLTVTKKRSS
jgi:hypothetical protein